MLATRCAIHEVVAAELEIDGQKRFPLRGSGPRGLAWPTVEAGGRLVAMSLWSDPVFDTFRRISAEREARFREHREVVSYRDLEIVITRRPVSGDYNVEIRCDWVGVAGIGTSRAFVHLDTDRTAALERACLTIDGLHAHVRGESASDVSTARSLRLIRGGRD